MQSQTSCRSGKTVRAILWMGMRISTRRSNGLRRFWEKPMVYGWKLWGGWLTCWLHSKPLSFWLLPPSCSLGSAGGEWIMTGDVGMTDENIFFEFFMRWNGRWGDQNRRWMWACYFFRCIVVAVTVLLISSFFVWVSIMITTVKFL